MQLKFFNLFSLLFVIFALLALSNLSLQDEYFTALVHMEKLLETERHIVDTLDRYLINEEKRITSLRQMAHHYNMLNSVASKDVESYLSNPVNAYLLVKRLTTDWKLVEYLINSDRRDLIEFLQHNDTFPSTEDLTGAAEALLRLQDTYKLDTTMLADGVIPIRDIRAIETSHYLKPTTTTSMALTANDCYELGRQAYINEDYYHTQLWMNEALRRIESEQSQGNEANVNDRVNMLEHLAFSAYKLGSVREANELTLQLLALKPDHERALGNLDYFKKELTLTNQIRRLKKGDDGDNDVSSENSISESSWPVEESERDIYESLCRGETRISEAVRSKLVCFYLDTSQLDPFIRLHRIKVEEAYRRPQIVVFHDIMSDYEVEVVRSLAQPKLKRATVQNYFTGSIETAKYRISKSAWLTNSEHKVVASLTKRIQSITGLDLSTAEELQVVNYGIGGHYEPHFDFARREEKNAFKSLGTGNRIATWLNYMSDVTAGGATVFPQLGVSVWPKKNSAAFWYNLHRSGDGDLLTRHAACPVLVGSKWVSNKWIHEVGQEFRKQCGLSRNEFNYVQKV